MNRMISIFAVSVALFVSATVPASASAINAFSDAIYRFDPTYVQNSTAYTFVVDFDGGIGGGESLNLFLGTKSGGASLGTYTLTNPFSTSRDSYGFGFLINSSGGLLAPPPRDKPLYASLRYAGSDLEIKNVYLTNLSNTVTVCSGGSVCTSSGQLGVESSSFNAANSLHSNFDSAVSSAENSDQDTASRNFSQILQAAADLNEDGKTTGEEAFLKTYFFVDDILFALDVLAGKATALPFILIPCDSTTLLFANCGNSDHFQVEASLFDILDFTIGVEYQQFDETGILGSEFVLPLLLDGFSTLARVELLSVDRQASGVRANYRIQTISDVTSAQVPEPSTLLLLAFGLLGLRRRLFQ